VISSGIDKIVDMGFRVLMSLVSAIVLMLLATVSLYAGVRRRAKDDAEEKQLLLSVAFPRRRFPASFPTVPVMEHMCTERPVAEANSAAK